MIALGLGQLESSRVSDDKEVPFYVCTENPEFLDSQEYRAKVAADIVSCMSGEQVQVFVLVHKHTQRFVFAQLGLADELLKLLHGGVSLVIINAEDEQTVQQMRRVIEELRGKQTGTSEAPLLDAFDDIALVTLRDVLNKFLSTEQRGVG